MTLIKGILYTATHVHTSVLLPEHTRTAFATSNTTPHRQHLLSPASKLIAPCVNTWLMRRAI